MKLRLASDIHLEFIRNHKPVDQKYYDHLDRILPRHVNDWETILLLSGDIDNRKWVHVAVEYWSHYFKYVLVIAGNHESYGCDLPRTFEKLEESTAHLNNVKILDSTFCEIDGVHFIGATFWSNMDNCDSLTMYHAELKMHDYKLIRTGPEYLPWHRRLKPVDTVNIHAQDKKFIFEKITEIKKLGKKCVVMTHHAPSFKSVDENYRGNSLNGAYATECFEDIWETEPDIWVHGHMHNSAEYTINKTRVFCNPCGYPVEENPDYNPTLTIEI